MPPVEYVKPEDISLKNYPEMNELWVQACIADDPSSNEPLVVNQPLSTTN